MRCRRCGHENPPAVRFCGACSATLEPLCPVCLAPNPAQNRFCHQCGRPLADPAPLHLSSPHTYTPRHLAERILTSRASLEGERRRVTVLFCDIANSTGLAEQVGPDVMHTVLNQFFRLALAEVHHYEGTVNQFLGDGLMALFGAPITHEDDALRAVRAAIGIQRAIREQRGQLPSAATKLAVRIGVNTGLVVVGGIGDNLRMDYTAIGDTTNLAARLQSLAPPGGIYVSEATQRVVRDVVVCEALGPQIVKGKADPVNVFRVLEPGPRSAGAVSPPPRRAIASLVGRGAEIETLNGCLEGLAAGAGGTVAIMGEAGVGKTRLVGEMRRLAAGAGFTCLEGGSISFGQTISYWPFLEMLRSQFGIVEPDSETESWVKVERAMTALFPDDWAEILPYVATLLALPVRGELEERVKYLDAEAMGRRIVLAMTRFLEQLATERPMVLVFEDLHWADHSSLELIEHLLARVGTVPILVCGVWRPDSEAPVVRTWTAARERYPELFTEIRLSPLTGPESATLLRELLHEGELPPSLSRIILRKSEGNPFFIEEVVGSLIDTGVLVSDGSGWRITRPVEDIVIPDTIQAVIMARIDRLEENAKQVLKVAAVIGRTFLYRVLRAIAEEGERLESDLSALQQSELIRQHRHFPELEYMFKHALAQEVAYETILLERRREMHRQVAACLETLCVARLEEFYGVLAHHYAEAEAWDKAQEYLFKAGDQAGKVAADTEALEHYRRALEAYGRAFGDRWDPVERARLERKIGEAFYRRGNQQLATEALERALVLLGSAPLPTSRWGVRAAIARAAAEQIWHRLRPWRVTRQEGSETAAEERMLIYETLGFIDYSLNPERVLLDFLLLLNLAEKGNPSRGVAVGLAGLGYCHDKLRLGRVAGYYCRRAVAIAEQLEHPVALGSAYLATALHEAEGGPGGSGRALEWLQRSKAAYQKAGDLHGWGAAAWQTAYFTFRRGDAPAALTMIREVARNAEEAGDQQLLGWAIADLGLMIMGTTGPESAAPHLERAVEILSGVPDYTFLMVAEAYLGQCRLRLGQLREAVAGLDSADRVVEERRLPGSSTFPVRTARAEAYLALAEGMSGAAQRDALRQALSACRTALRQAKATADAIPEAWRVEGMCRWLTGRHNAARSAWRQSINEAEALELPYEAARTRMEMGRLTRSVAELEQAAIAFDSLGATWDLAHTRRLLAAGGDASVPAAP